jgi:signal transduction histidine kinase
MRGKISVVSELNKGTVFIIEIPVESEVALSVTGQNDVDT